MHNACPIHHLCNYCTLQKQTMQYCISSNVVLLKTTGLIAHVQMLHMPMTV